MSKVAKIVIVEGLIALGCIAASPVLAFDKDTVPNLVLWLAADQGIETNVSGVVINWVDQSASGNNATLLLGNPKFQAGYQNGKPGVAFDGNGDALAFTQITDVRTVFWVLHEKSSTTENWRHLLSDSDAADFHRGAGKAIFDSTYAAAPIKNGSAYVNGVAVGNGTGTVVPNVPAIIVEKTAGNATASRLGQDRNMNDRTWDGTFAEVLIFNRALTAEEMNTVGCYLSAKYDIASSYSDGTVVTAELITGAASAISREAATVHGGLISTGKSSTTVTLYWGETDKGTNLSSWAHSVSLGVRDEGAFSSSLTGLAEDTLCYYTFTASNTEAVVYSQPRYFRTALDVSHWAHRMKVRFAGYNRGEALTNFPVLIRYAFDSTGFLSQPYNDLRFIDTHSISLNYEMDKWNAEGLSSVWVQVPRLAEAGDFIWAYWGRRNCTLPAFTTNGATWSEGFGGVWHLSEQAAHLGLQVDSTAFTNHGTYYNSEGNGIPGDPNGVIGGADFLTASNGYVLVPHAASLQPLHAVSCELWSKSIPTLWSGNGCLLNKRNSYMLHPNKALRSLMFQTWLPTATGPTYTPADITGWHHYAGTYEGTTIRLFFDGVPVETTTLQTEHRAINPDTGVLRIGRDYDASEPSRFLEGWIDEVRVSGQARSTNWIWASWASQVPSSTFVQYDSVEQVLHMQGSLLLIK